MAYEPGLVQAVLRTAKRKRASARPRKAVILAGLVESGLQHKKYGAPGSGDRDSVGFLQQRPSQGWGAAGESAEVDTEQFLDRAMELNRKGFRGSAGQLAQAVQRSAFPEKYDQRSKEAEQIMRGVLGQSQAPRSRDASMHAMSLGNVAGTSQDASQSPSVFDVIRRFNAATTGQDAPEPGGLDAQLARSQEMLMDAIARRQQPQKAKPSVASMGTSFDSVSDEGEWEGSQAVASNFARVGLDLGLKSTSEKRHNTNPHSGKNSDHEETKENAYAFDLSNGSAPTPEMDQAAFQIMRQLGFKDYKPGQPIDTRRGVKIIKTKRGTFRIQVIYRGDGASFGGNHLDHIHVGVQRVG